MEKFNFLAKVLINKTRSKFWGVTTLPPLRKISSSRFVKICVEQKTVFIKRNRSTAQRQCGYSERAISGVKPQCDTLA